MSSRDRKSSKTRRYVTACFALALGITAAVPAQGQGYGTVLGVYTALREGARQNDPTKTLALTVLLAGVIDGIRAMNAAYIDAGAKPQFCLPRDFEMPAIYLRDAIDELLTRQPTWREQADRFDLGFVAVEALEERFPCKE